MNKNIIKKIILLFLVQNIFFTRIVLPAEYSPDEIIIKVKVKSQESLKKISERLRISDNMLGIASIDNLNKRYNTAKIKSLFLDNAYNSLKKQNSLGLIEGTYLIRFNNPVNINDILQDYSSNPEIEYAQLNYVYRIHKITNNREYSKQWGLSKINAEGAWQIERGSKDVLIAIIDTGIDYWHKDLKDNIWINSGEDLNSNGMADSSDFNGIDDDGNGFIDDIQGWDFTDAPSYPDDGDYLEPDNDPIDEMGHGTAVAGIAAGTGEHEISGVAPGCRLMNLRAATAKGYLQDDDVASAVVYAVENGAGVINMSFGDFIYSRVLRDVIKFAYINGCVVVTSSGNNGDDRITYPGSFDETISVGATNEEDSLASFSTFGNTVDITAPGINIYSSKIGGGYGNINGTSAAAPFVSGLAALLISKNRNLFPDQIRSILMSSAEDLGDYQYDSKYGAGRINASKALSIDNISVAQLSTPEIFSDTKNVEITGTASGPGVKYYSLYYGIGKNPQSWDLIKSNINSRIVEDKIGIWNIESLVDDTYCLRLVVANNYNSITEDRVIVSINRSLPKIESFSYTDMLDKDRVSLFIKFETAEPSRSTIFYREKGADSDFQIKESEYAVKSHKVNIPAEEMSDIIEFYVEAENENGTSARYDNNGECFVYAKDNYPFLKWSMVKKEYSLPSLFLMPSAVNFDNDNKKEIIANIYENSFSFGKLGVFEYDNGLFEQVVTTDFKVIPRDAGDFDSDGKGEILGGLGAKSVIIEALEEGLFPSDIVWESEEDLWASRFYDIDNDGKKEMIARIDNEFVLLENTGDNSYTISCNLPNPTGGSNGAGIPRSEVGDFDNDGKKEILLGDSDGDIYIYECNSEGSFEHIWSYRLPQIDAVDFISAGDFDGDGADEFIAGCHSENYPSEFNDPKIRYWSYAIFKSKGDNDFEKVWEKDILGFDPLNIFSSGCFSGDLDNDGKKEIVISAHPDLYILDFDENDYEIVWYFKNSRTSRFIIDDIDGNGVKELFFNNGKEVLSYENDIYIKRPLPPFNLNAFPVDTSKNYLNWDYSSVADYFNIYRGFDKNSISKITETNENYYYDTNLEKDRIYWYFVTAVDGSFQETESIKPPAVFAKPNKKPFIEDIEFIPQNRIILLFSEPMDKGIMDETKYKISSEKYSISSAAYSKSGREVILTIKPDITESGNYNLEVSKEIRDIDFTPIDTSSVLNEFYVPVKLEIPYITEAEVTRDNLIIIKFNLPMDKTSASVKENYSFEPELHIEDVLFNDERQDEVSLKIKKEYGISGKDYLVTVKNLKSAAGAEIIEGRGNTVSLYVKRTDLSEVYAYPNPYNPLSGLGYITFANLTDEVKIWITDISGRLIKKIEENGGNGGANWYLDNENGEKISSGIYIYYIEGNGNSVKGKLAIMR